ncbi:MAG: serine/threonine-protein kinase [Minicystis sp.]
MSAGPAPQSVGRYTLLGEIASGGMATVHLGRLAGPGGFTQRLAIKRLHTQHAKDPEFVSMFLDEARIAAHVQHANVIRVFEVLLEGGELFLVMEHVRGETLARLLELSAARGELARPAIAVAIATSALAGLDAAHDAKDDGGQPLGIVHRDVSPQNILVGVDGVPRILDFGIAKAMSRLHTTRPGQIKGKLAYMAPEQRHGRAVDRRADIYAMGIVLWELLTGRRLFGADGAGPVAPPSTIAPGVPAAVDAAVLKALARDPEARFATARDFAIALEEGGEIASTRAVSEWLRNLAGEELEQRDRAVGAIERAAEETAVVSLPIVAAPTIVEPRPIAAPPPARPSSVRRIALVALALAIISALLVWAVRAHAAPDTRRSPGAARLG